MMEHGSSGGGGGGSHSPGEEDGSDSNRRNKRYHRHTSNQIQRLESMFKECPHPDEKQRMQLSRELGLAPRQIKFWFQNRRTQMKAQHERADNSTLRAENDKIRCENVAIREALKNVICPTCGGPPHNEDSYFDDQKMRLENAQLKEELDRVSSIAAKYIGRPISQLPSLPPFHISSLDLSMGMGSTNTTSTFGTHHQGLAAAVAANCPSSLDLDHLLQAQAQAQGAAGTSSSSSSNYHDHLVINSLSDMDKSLMSNIASNALQQLLRLFHTNEPLWIKSPADGRDVLNFDTYQRMFPNPNNNNNNTRLKNPNVRVEASRDSGIVIMNTLTLADMFMDPNKWMELFPTIVSAARTIEVISSGMMGAGHNGSLQLMYEELQVLSPHVPSREFYFLRYCQQIEQGTWAIVDVSYDFPQHINQFRSYRLPSGCLIQDMPNGHSKVTWIEHVEIEDKSLPHRLFRNVIYSGLAFGAERWIGTLQRMCERLACLMVLPNPTRDLGAGVITSGEGKRSMMKLAQRMVTNFCGSVGTSSGNRWTTLNGLNEVAVRCSVHKSTDPGQPNGVVLCAATTIWLPLPPHIVFNFFNDETKRPQWDVLSNGNPVQEVAHIVNGSHPGNSISVLRAFNGSSSQNNMLILQESCIDSSGALVVYCPVDVASINIAMSGEDPSYIPLLPSGFTICTDGHHHQSSEQHGGGDGASSSSSSSSCSNNTIINRRSGRYGGGSLVTVAFQILVSNLPSAKLNMDSVTTVNNLIATTIHQIKASFNSPTTAS